MCGRFGFFDLKYFLDLLRQLELPFEEHQGFHPENQYNISPETDILTLHASHGTSLLTMACWGLVPSWAKERPEIRPINACAELLVSKPSYRHLVGRNHCLIPASGFYEWKHIEGKKKQPWYTSSDGWFTHGICRTLGHLETKRQERACNNDLHHHHHCGK